MRKLSYLLIALVILSFSLFSITYAQETARSRVSGGFNLGIARFLDNVDDLGTGFSIRGYGEYILVPNISLLFMGGYIEFDEDVSLGSGTTFATTEPVRFDEAYVTGGLKVRFVPRGKFTPFVMGSVGVYNGHKEDVTPITTGIADTTKTIESNDFGFNVGGGVEYFVSKRVSLAFEVLFHFTEGDIDEELVDFVGGLRYAPVSVQ
jgi:opacity protein-like surface antigen